MPGNVMAGVAAATKVANNRKLLGEQGTFLSIQWSYGGRASKPFIASSTLRPHHSVTVTEVASLWLWDSKGWPFPQKPDRTKETTGRET